MVGDVPVAVARFHAGEDFLECFFARRVAVFLERAAEQTVQAKAVGQPRNRMTFGADLRFAQDGECRIGRGTSIHGVR